MNWNLFPWHSLKIRLTVLTLGIFMISIWSFSLYVSQTLREDMQRLLGEQQFSTVSIVAADIDDELNDRLKGLEVVAKSINPATLGNTAALQTLLEQRPILQMLFNGGTFVVGIDGTATASLPLSARRSGVNYMDRDYVTTALREAKSTIGKPIIGRQLHTPVVAMAVPIRDAQDRVIGALAGIIDLGRTNFLDKITKSSYGKSGGYLLIAPQHRLIVTATDKSRTMEPLPAKSSNQMEDRYLQGYEGYGVATNTGGQEELSAAKGIPVAGWLMVAALPTAEAFAPIHVMQQRMLLAAIMLTLLASVLIWWLLRRQLSPLLATAKTLIAQSETDKPMQPLPIARQDEIGKLIGGFNSLLKTLGSRETALKDSEARYRAVTHSAHEAIVTSDEAGNIVGWNLGAETLFGYTASEVTGRPITLLVPEKYHYEHLALMNSVWAGGELCVVGKSAERYGQRKDGSEFPLELSLAKWESAEGCFITGIIRDMTEHVREERLLRLEHAISRCLADAGEVSSALKEVMRVVCESQKWGVAIYWRVDEVAGVLRFTESWDDPESKLDRYIEESRTTIFAAGTGLVGRVWQSGEPIWVADFSADPRVVQKTLARELRMQGAFMFSVISEGQTLGVFAFLGHALREPDERLLAATRVIGNEVGQFLRRKHSESELHESEARFRSLTEMSSDFYWETDAEHRISQLSSGSNSVTLAHGSPMGKRRWEIPYLSPDEAGWQAHQATLAEHLPIRNFEFSRLEANGAERHASINGDPVFDAAGNFKGYRGVGANITERKNAEIATRHAIEEQTAIFESATSGIAFVKDRIIINCNRTLDQLFGYEPGELIGQTTRYWYADDEAFQAGGDPYPALARGEIHQREQLFRRKDGTDFMCRLSGTAIDAGDLSRGTVWMFNDITRERQTVEAMQQAKDLAEEATRMKSDFLANMSHEIRTPMNAIIGMSRLCLGTNLQQQQRDYVEKVHGAGQSLLGIINDILDFSKIEAGKLEMESIPFHLSQAFDNLASLTAAKAQEKGLELLFQMPFDDSCHLLGDPLRLGQVLLNLVGNAIKFTDTGEIQVHATPLNITDDVAEFEFRIQDSGIGMTAEQCGRLFQPFSQADSSTTRKYGGSGLGLAISKHLVEIMGGTIRLESVPGAGTTFIFTARFGRARAADMPKKNSLSADLRQLKILVVDDIDSARQTLKSMLIPFSCRVTCVDSGLAALSALENAAEDDPYRLVLMDWHMPDLDGVEASRRIKTNPKLAEIPTIIMVTAHGREIVMEKAASAGLDGFLIKPVTPSMLLDTITGVLNPRGRIEPVSTSSTWEIKTLHDIKNARVLVVDDNSINQQIARELLHKAGLRVAVANNGQEAFDMVERERYDAVLMDLQMPVMDGFEATRAIRGIPAFKDLPIIAMTANAMAGDREKCLAAGMNDHVAKPIDPDLLFKALTTWITLGNSASRAKDISARPPATAAKGTLPDNLPGIDMALALKRLGGDAALLQKILPTFLHDHRDDALTIRRALQADDMELAKRITHTLKGVAGSIGATALQSAAAALDTALAQGATETCAGLLGTLENALALVSNGLARLGERDAKGKSTIGPIDSEAILPLLDYLSSLLQELDPDAEITASTLRRQLGAGPAQSLADDLVEQLANYDFNVAGLTLAQLREMLKVPS
jgi:two-component system sensor histidine kinase/response regulator